MAIKNDVAALLEQSRGTAVSGQELADRLGVSRAAVWKAVKQLQQEGYRISAGTNRGYVLEPETDVLTEAGIRNSLPKKYSGLPVKVYRTVGSTNTEAKAAALQGAPHGSIIAADGQSTGRGRLGKSFYSPEGTGLYMSVILKPNMPLSDCTYITMAAAVALVDSIERVCGITAGIKWVNDIFCRGKKVAGVLTEAISDFESGMAETVIVGAGVNISTADFPEDIAGIAGSLGVFAQRSRLCADIAANLLDYTENSSHDALVEKYRAHSLLTGREITFLQNGVMRSGRVAEIDPCGCLVVETPEGREVLRSGEVSVVGGFAPV
ncbi:MAG: biotin--[acetyl-CoA-carboxylase] ligase [Oscillospiraceae bacterium]